MYRKLIYLVSFVLVLSFALTGTAKAELVGWWKFDEGSGTIAYDSSGYGNDGTLNGDPEWVIGKIGSALEFDGADDFVSIPDKPDITFSSSDSYTLTTWIYVPEVPGGWNGIVTKGRQSGGGASYYGIWIGDNSGTPTWYFGTWPTWGSAVAETGWYHVAVVQDGAAGTKLLYLNGEIDTQTAAQAGDAAGNLVIGSDQEPGDSFAGITDEVRLYNHPLSEVEILSAMEAKPWPYAFGPDPADGVLISETWVNLSWTPGALAVSHDVYIGDNFDAVNEGAEGTFISNQADTFIVAGFPGFPYPDGLVPGTTYYWRIDEVNDTEPNSPWKGDVWSFSIPPKTAYFPDPADSAESVDVDAGLSWTGGFGAKLHTVYFGDNFNDVNNATGGQAQGTATYSPGTLKMAKTYYWRVDEFDIVETHKGDVWNFLTQGAVASLNPANGAVDVTQIPTLTWTSGFGASHEVYFGADASSLELKGTGNLGSESYDPGLLEWNTTYYWRVDEANNANAGSPWTGPLWSFTTANFLIVDDFESYNDLDEGEPGSNRIYLAWVDGFDNPTLNGSVVGNANAPFTEQTIVNNGIQSMPMAYDNAVGKSEATLTLTSNRDWTVNGVTTLTIWYRGASANAAETMYVALNDSAAVTNDNPDAVLSTSWTEWNIDLQVFADQGVNLANVTSITLGLGNRNNPVAGGSGMMYFDDIRLYRPAP